MLPFLALAATLAGTAISMNAQRSAQKKQQAIMEEGRRRNLELQNKATNLAAQRANDFDAQPRAEAEKAIETQQTNQFENAALAKPVTNSGLAVGASPQQGDVYDTAAAKKAAATTASLRQLAQIMGRLGAANQLRQNESIRFGDTANEIGQIQNNARNMSQIDEMQANAIRPNMGASILGQALTGYGMGGLSSVGGAANPFAGGSYGATPIMNGGFDPRMIIMPGRK